MATMELKFLTPTEVWEGFDAIKAPLEASIISVKTTDNFSCAQQVFTADTVQDAKLRVECNIYFDARWQDERPAVLVLPSFENPHSSDAIHKLVEEGFVTCTIDYCALKQNSMTYFPDSVSFAHYPDCLEHLEHIETDARQTPWFVWAKIARRAISLLQEQSIVQKDKIGLIGFGAGAHLSYLVAGTDKRVKSMVAINGGGYRWAEHNARFLGNDIPTGDEQIAYSTGVGAETYAIFIDCPTLMIATRDSELCDVDRLGDMFDLVKSNDKHIMISVSCCAQIARSIYGAMTYWLRNNLAGTLEFTLPQPSIRFEETDGRLYVKLNSGEKATERTLFISYGEPCSKQRHWEKHEVKQKVGAHEYVCDVPVYDPNELLIAYACFTYPNGGVVSTRIVSASSVMAEVTHIETSPRTSSILFDGSMGVDKFVAKTDDALLDNDTVELKQGPFGIEGVSVEHGSLTLYRSKQETMAVSRSAILHFDAYSTQERELLVCVYSDTELKKYTARKKLQGGEFWQKLLLETTDFKSEEGRTLSSFSQVKTIEFENVDGILLNNLLWI